MDKTNEQYYFDALELLKKKDYISALAIFRYLLLVVEEDSEKKMFKKNISKIYYKLYEENLKNEKYFSSYELLVKAQEYCENKDQYKEQLNKAISLKYLREGESKLYIEKDSLTALEILNSSYELYPDINEKINKQREFDINYANYEYFCSFYNDLKEENYYLYEEKKEEIIKVIDNCNDEFFRSKLNNIKSKILLKFNLYHSYEFEYQEELDKAIEICEKNIQNSEKEFKEKFKQRLSSLYQKKGEKLWDKYTNEDDLSLVLEIFNYFKQAINLINNDDDNYNRLKLNLSKIEITIIIIKANNFCKEKKYEEAYENYMKAKNKNEEYNGELYSSKDLEEKIQQMKELLEIQLDKKIDNIIPDKIKNINIIPKEIQEYNEQLKKENKNMKDDL